MQKDLQYIFDFYKLPIEAKERKKYETYIIDVLFPGIKYFRIANFHPLIEYLEDHLCLLRNN